MTEELEGESWGFIRNANLLCEAKAMKKATNLPDLLSLLYQSLTPSKDSRTSLAHYLIIPPRPQSATRHFTPIVG